MLKTRKIRKILTDYLPTLIKTEIIRLIPASFDKISFKKKTASLNITDRCNLRCVMCKQWRQKYDSQELSTEEWKNTLDQLKKEGIEEVNFSGGEPLLRPDIFDLIKHTTSIGLNCGITSNGYLLDEVNIQKLIRSGVKIFTISIDALNDHYERIRGVKGAFARVENAARILASLKKINNLSVSVSFVLMKPTLEHLSSLISFCKNLDLALSICLLDRTPYFFDLDNGQSALWIDRNDFSELERAQYLLAKEKKTRRKLIYNTFSDIKFFKSYFNDPIQKRIPCVVAQTRICIDPRGNVYGGCWSMANFGNLKEKSLKEIVVSEKYRNSHKNMFFKKCPGCSCGYSTNLKYSILSQINNVIKFLIR